MTSGTLPTFVVEAISETIGRSRRVDPVEPSTGGPAGNARLTAWTGLVLLALSLAEVITLVNLSSLISWHVVIGVLLIPPALLKTASTGWRILRYYRKHPPYATAGPPPLVLRLLGPAVVLFTMALLGSGLLLLALGPDRSHETLLRLPLVSIDAITIHQAMFACWAVVTGLHVIGRFVPALRLTVTSAEPSSAIPGRTARVAILVTVALVAAVAGRLSLLAIGGWHDAVAHHGDGTLSSPLPRRGVTNSPPRRHKLPPEASQTSPRGVTNFPPRRQEFPAELARNSLRAVKN